MHLIEGINAKITASTPAKVLITPKICQPLIMSLYRTQAPSGTIPIIPQ